MQHLGLYLLLLQVAGSSLVFFECEKSCFPNFVGVSTYKCRLCIDDDKLVVKDCSSNLEVHHYGPEALHSRTNRVREGSLVVVNPTSSAYRVDQYRSMSKMIEYWRYLFHAGEVAFGDMAKKIKELDCYVNVYLVARPGTDAIKHRFKKRPLEYPNLSGLGHLVNDYDLIDVALEDPSLGWVDFVDNAHTDLIDAWTSTLDRALKLLGIIVCSVITKQATRDQALEVLRGLSGYPSVEELLSAHEDGAKVREAIHSIVGSAHPLLEVVRVGKKFLGHAPYLRALTIEILYYMEKMVPGRVEMAHDVVELQDVVQRRCKEIKRADPQVQDPDVFKATISRLENDPKLRDNVWTMFVCLKYSVLLADMKEALVRESMEVCQKHQLQEAIPMLFMLSFGRWDWDKSGGFYQELKTCQSIGTMFQTIAEFLAKSKEHECQRQSYWRLYCEGAPSSAPHFADLVTNGLSCARIFERPYCQCNGCVNWDMSKDVLFQCIGEGVSRPMGLACNLRRVLSHLSHCPWEAEMGIFRTCIDSMRPGWHSQYTLNDAAAWFVFRSGPPLIRRALAFFVHKMKLEDRTVPELPNQTMLVKLAWGVPEESRLKNFYCDRFNESGVGAVEVASRWTVKNSDYMLLFQSFVNGVVCILEDGVVAMSSCAFQDSNTADSLMGCAGPRTVAQLSKTISSRHSHISVQADRQSNRIRVCRAVGSEFGSEWWTQSVVLRWSLSRGVSIYFFDRGQKQTVYFSCGKVEPELFCVLGYCGRDPVAKLLRCRMKTGTIRGARTVRSDSGTVPIVEENEELDSLIKPTDVEVRLTDANKTNPVVRILSEHCLNGILHKMQNVKTWEHMVRMVRELQQKNLIAAFRLFGGQ